MGSTIARMMGKTSSLFVFVVIVIAMALMQQQHSMPPIRAYGQAASNITSNITSTSCIDNQPCVTTICINNNPCHTFKSNSNSTANTNTTKNNTIHPSPEDSNKLDQQNV